MTDHYFAASPASPDERRVVEVSLAGRSVEVETAPGVFSPGHVDLGTEVLLRHVPTPEGSVLDLGCGWGPLALAAALANPACRVTAVDVNERALDLVRTNAARVGRAHPLGALEAVRPDDVADDAAFDVLWSNPPIRIGKAALHELLAAWIPRVRPGGAAYLVVQRHLGADSLQRWLADQGWGAVERVGSAKGFRVLRVARAGATEA